MTMAINGIDASTEAALMSSQNAEQAAMASDDQFEVNQMYPNDQYPGETTPAQDLDTAFNMANSLLEIQSNNFSGALSAMKAAAQAKLAFDTEKFVISISF